MKAITTAEDMLNSPEFFECDRMHARIKKSICVSYQEIGYRMSCQNCDQGKEIARELNVSTIRMNKRPFWPYFGYPKMNKRGKEMNEQQNICMVDDCTEPVKYRGLCKSCYFKWYYGALPGIEPLPSKTGKGAKKEKEDFTKIDKTDQVKESGGIPVKMIMQINCNPILETLQVLEDLFNKQIDSIKQAIAQIKAINKTE